MIEVKDSIARVEGTPKLVCIELTHLLVHLIKTFEKEYGVEQRDAITVLNECARIAYMTDEERAKELVKLMEKD